MLHHTLKIFFPRFFQKVITKKKSVSTCWSLCASAASSGSPRVSFVKASTSARPTRSTRKNQRRTQSPSCDESRFQRPEAEFPGAQAQLDQTQPPSISVHHDRLAFGCLLLEAPLRRLHRRADPGSVPPTEAASEAVKSWNQFAKPKNVSKHTQS